MLSCHWPWLCLSIHTFQVAVRLLRCIFLIPKVKAMVVRRTIVSCQKIVYNIVVVVSISMLGTLFYMYNTCTLTTLFHK